MHELEILFKSSKIRLDTQGDRDQIIEFENAKNLRARELLNAQKEATNA